MATRTLVTEDEYLHTAYEPDCEFEGGLQAALASWFFRRRKAWAIHVYTEQRIKMRDGKYMIPDICVVQGPEPAEQVFTAPPLIWIEILSPEDRHVRVNQNVQQALGLGTPYVWVIDPETLESELHTARGHAALPDGVLKIPGTEIEVPLNRVFED